MFEASLGYRRFYLKKTMKERRRDRRRRPRELIRFFSSQWGYKMSAGCSLDKGSQRCSHAGLMFSPSLVGRNRWYVSRGPRAMVRYQFEPR